MAPSGDTATAAAAAAATTAGPATKVQSASTEYGYPHGHLGHLTAEEETAFTNFKAYLTEQGLYKAGPPPSHDDTILLRFLRARRWVQADAYKQFKDTEEWRASVSIDVLYDTIDVEAYDESRQLYPQWTGRRDRRGIPVYLFEIKHLDSKSISRYEKSVSTTFSKAPPPKDEAKTPAKLIRLFALYENLTRFVQPLCTQLTDRDHARTPITLSTNIVDVSGVSLKQFWNLKGHMQLASQLATAHYPETLDRIFIIGAPIFFSTVWGWIKRWFDPVTVSKIFILSQHEVLPVLTSFIDIKNIPKQYGGELDFQWCQMPNLDNKIKDLATWENGFTEFPKGPIYWRPIEGGKRLEAVARGTIKKEERHVRVCTIPRAFADEPEETKAVAAAPEVPSGEAAAETAVMVEELPAAAAPAPEALAGEAADTAVVVIEKPAAAAAAASVPPPQALAGEAADTAVVTDSAKELSPASPTDEEFKDAPEQPPKTPTLTEVQGMQNLALKDPEKSAEGGAVPNGKAEVA